MTKGITVERRFQTPKTRPGVRCQEKATSLAAIRVPRIARLMALAIRFDQLIRDGVVSDQAELARLGHVSRARLTQLMNLLNLAPDIQEQIVLGDMITNVRDHLTERRLRWIVAESSWRKQRQLWIRLLT